MDNKLMKMHDKICEVCNKPFQTKRNATKICSPECVSVKISNSRKKYTEEQIEKAIKLKLNGTSSKEIEAQTGIKKCTQDNLFKERNIKLTDEQKSKLLSKRWENYNPLNFIKK